MDEFHILGGINAAAITARKVLVDIPSGNTELFDRQRRVAVVCDDTVVDVGGTHQRRCVARWWFSKCSALTGYDEVS